MRRETTHMRRQRLLDVLVTHPHSTARDLGERLKMRPDFVMRLLREFETMRVATFVIEWRTVPATHRGATRAVSVWTATTTELPLDGVDLAWTPPPYVNPIRARALGLPVAETERTREVREAFAYRPGRAA